MDKPVLPSNITADEVKYKILLVGKSGIGKTSTIAKLSGNEIPATHSETPGNHYPSARLQGKDFFFVQKRTHNEYLLAWICLQIQVHGSQYSSYFALILAGIHITTTQWPGMVKQMNKIVMFHLQFWDVGDGAMKKYEHIKTVSVLSLYLKWVKNKKFEQIEIIRIHGQNKTESYFIHYTCICP